MADAWGQLFRDYLDGVISPHFIERDDGRKESFPSGAPYFSAPRLEAESELLGLIEGPVLDLGAGAGSYALYLQERGLVVTAADSSPEAVKVCLRRWCESAEIMDLRNL